MPLSPRTRLGSYEIVRPIGSGGMGEVYEARDVRLDRPVAVKILIGEFPVDAASRERFRREARVISQLQDPHICALYDIGTHEDRDYLVLEYLEGETLAARLERGALPVPEALRIARQIASALDAAHRHGIVHRDLKPGNVMLTRSAGSRGATPRSDLSTHVKLLDFGLAKAAQPGSKPANATTFEGPAADARPLTAEGTLLGTYQYMAPEQIEGGAVDARTDLWALGCVLYEMVTGTRAFQGRTPASVMGAILKDDPPLVSSRQPLSPEALDRLVQTCLAKDANDRFSTPRDFILALSFVGGSSGAVPAALAGTRNGRRAWRGYAIAAGTFVLISAVATVSYFAGAARRATAPPVSLDLLAPDGTAFADAPVVSPDGQSVVFQAGGRLWLRRLDRQASTPIAGTEGGYFPFWSPDGRSIGFGANRQLNRIDVDGSAPIRICGVPDFRGGTWLAGDVVIFANVLGPLMRVPAGGGQPEPLTSLADAQGEVSHRFPVALPNGGLLFQVTTQDAASVGVWMASLAHPQDRRLIVKTQSHGEFAGGQLIFVRDGAVVAQPLDVETGRLTGRQTVVAERVRATGVLDRWAFSASPNGTIAIGGNRPSLRQLEVVNHRGESLARIGSERRSGALELSPTNDRVAIVVDQKITIVNLQRGDEHRLIDSPESQEFDPLWTSDGSQIVFSSYRSQSGNRNLFSASVADGQVRPVVPPAVRSMDALGFGADGALYLRAFAPARGFDDILKQRPGAAQPEIFLDSNTSKGAGRISPDGKWIAYRNDAGDRAQVVVRSLLNKDVAKHVSVAGGEGPRWSADGHEVYFVSLTDDLMALDVQTTPSLAVGTPRPLFRAGVLQNKCWGHCWDVFRDGRFLLNRVTKPGLATLTVITNWKGPEAR